MKFLILGIFFAMNSFATEFEYYECSSNQRSMVFRAHRKGEIYQAKDVDSNWKKLKRTSIIADETCKYSTIYNLGGNELLFIPSCFETFDSDMAKEGVVRVFQDQPRQKIDSLKCKLLPIDAERFI